MSCPYVEDDGQKYLIAQARQQWDQTIHSRLNRRKTCSFAKRETLLRQATNCRSLKSENYLRRASDHEQISSINSSLSATGLLQLIFWELEYLKRGTAKQLCMSCSMQQFLNALGSTVIHIVLRKIAFHLQ